MVKSQLVDNIAEKHHTWAFKDIIFSVNLILETLSEALAEGDRIEIRTFGSFSRKLLQRRKAHNPKTGQMLYTKEKHRVRFRAAKYLRQRIDSKQGSQAQDVNMYVHQDEALVTE